MASSGEQWQPVGIEGLEPAALNAVRTSDHACVVAGPGSGKTELLAQRATFLLQAGHCASPSRILAISFKKDSATNLTARVTQRSTSEQALRFDSMTFDAFAKSIVDRFRLCLPAVWRPQARLKLRGSTRAEFDRFTRYLSAHRPSWRETFSTLTLEKFEHELFGTYPLPLEPEKADDAITCAILNWAKQGVASQQSISFPLLNRLAEVILRDGSVRRALLATYPYVFIDEFQDTSHAQYDLLMSVFARGDSNITAVGDDKQRIMLWAGAKPDAFASLTEELGVQPFELVYNYRSSSALVSLQRVVSNALDPGSLPVESRSTLAGEISGSGAIELWVSRSKTDELSALARWISDDKKITGNAPGDYVVLVRQKADDFEREIRPYFSHRGLKLVNHSRYASTLALQDLLKDDLAMFNLQVLRLATAEANPKAWESVRTIFLYLKQVDLSDDNPLVLRLEEYVQRSVDQVRSLMSELRLEERSVAVVCAFLRELFSDDLWARGFTAYQDSDGLERSRSAFEARMMQSMAGVSTWRETVANFSGEDAIPIMSVHKSKGLEFHTVVNVGFDDSSWWSYEKDRGEGDSTFFVALSRARAKLLFLHNEARGGRQEIGRLFNFLQEAGVPETQILEQGESPA